MKRNGIWMAALGIAVGMQLAPARVRAQDAEAFFRIVSPTTTVIKGISRDGTIVWSNAATVGVTGRTQRATTLLGPSNWTDFAGFTVTGPVMAARLFDPHPPAGMVLIPAGVNSGTNPMTASEVYSAPVYPPDYSVTVSAFYMDATEITKAQWDVVRGWAVDNGYTDLHEGGAKAANHPVSIVSWYSCVKWCNARSQKAGRTPTYYTDAAFTQVYKNGEVKEPYVKATADGYRLPTDAQWEYAARGGVSSRRFPWGDSDDIQHARANYVSSSLYSYDTSPTRGENPLVADSGYFPHTSPVGSFPANGYGLYDMTGNVLEWCYDWRPGVEGQGRELRGGSWYTVAYYCRIGHRYNGPPDYAHYFIGFRTILPVSQ